MTFTSAMKVSSKGVGNTNLSGRVKQIVVLIIAILIGMVISTTAADAKDFNRENQKRNKSAYKKQNNNLNNACQILSQKRNITSNKVVKETSKLKYR